MLKQETFTMTTKTQTNQFSIYLFIYLFLKQQDSAKGIIDYEFLYSGSYVEYFNWLIKGLTAIKKLNYMF